MSTLEVRPITAASDRRNSRSEEMGSTRISRRSITDRRWGVGNVELRGSGMSGFPDLPWSVHTHNGL